MRASVLLSIAYTFVQLVTAKPVQLTNHGIICNPLDSNDCYPEVLVPSTEWQTIREGQSIPPGLHVRLNIDTLLKEAKIMDDSEDSNALQVVVQPEEEHVVKVAPKSGKSKVNFEDLNDFSSAINEVGDYSGDKARLGKALEVLDDLSHDLEFGVKLTSVESLTYLNNLLELNDDPSTHEKVYRIIGASLRNNPDAIDNYLTHTPRVDILSLFGKIKKPTPAIIKNRILGIISALNSNSMFHSIYFTNYGLSYLVSQYPDLESQNKQRLINIFEDLNLIIVNGAKRNSEDPDGQMSSFLQESLIDNKLTPAQLESYFNGLVAIHTKDKSIKPTPEFMVWLSNQVEHRKELRKRGGEDFDFDQEMLRARHEVFGNPNGLRKAIADEL